MREDVETVVIGAGQSGLAVSRLLTAHGRDHVVVDRGRPGERWRSERWRSLRLLTPNWLTRLPGRSYTGDEPDGFMAASEVAQYLEDYAAEFCAPVIGSTSVHRVAREGGGFLIETSRGAWRAQNVVVATGPHALPRTELPESGLPGIPVTQYREPGALPDGGVLVVGASASGVQIASELADAGRDVTLAVGRHTRMPRAYRGMDIFWWMQATGALARIVARDGQPVRPEPSLQIVGAAPGSHHGVDLPALAARGVRLTGRLVALSGRTAQFDGSLPWNAAKSDAAMHRFLDRVDAYAAEMGLARELEPPLRPRAFVPQPGPLALDLRARGIGSVVVATGLQPDYAWLDVSVVGPDGLIAQRRGVTEVPGLYVVGQPMQHRRDSTLIDGARHNALDVVSHLLRSRLSDDVAGAAAVIV